MRVRHLKIIGISIGIFLLAAVAVQLLYPTGRLLPFVRINGAIYGGQTVDRAIERLDAHYSKAYLELEVGGAASITPLTEVGIDVSTTTTVLNASKYTLLQRLIPFSSLVIMISRDAPIVTRIDEERIHYFATQFEQQSATSAANATVIVEGDTLSLVPARPQKGYAADALYKTIIDARMAPTIKIVPAILARPAEITDIEAMPVLAAARAILDVPLTMQVGDTEVTADKHDIASWFDFPVRDGKIELTLQTEEIKKYIESVQYAAYKAPLATRITTLDGDETNRVVGVSGKGVDTNAAARQVEEHLLSRKGGKLALTTVDLAPGTAYDRQYSDTNSGLNALLHDVAAGRDYGISIIELGGRGRTANADGDKVYMAASTYKLYIAYAVFDLVAKGEMHWDDIVSGLRVETCLQKMIVNSDNPCATAFGNQIGWTRIQNMMHGIGLSTATRMKLGSNYTTANDLALFLRKLEDGSLLPTASRDQLLSLMKKQIYRKGIPAAVDAAVADKVGFIGSYIHDAGIVYGSKGAYVMVIMSSGSNWSALSAVAKNIDVYLTR